MKCKICRKDSNKIFDAIILNNYNIDYFYCSNCGFLQTEEPYWLEEAYKEPINFSDTGYVQRNLFYSKKLTLLLTLIFERNGKYLDYAAGYGMFVRLMRDVGFDFFWQDKYTENLFSFGFEYDRDVNYDAVTSFECFEHFVNPIEEIEKILLLSKNIIFSTNLLPHPVPKSNDWWYYGLNHGQHLSFYSESTFQFIAEKYGLHYSHSGNLHLLTEKKIFNSNLRFLKLTKLGLHQVLKKQVKSKTWADHLEMKNKKNIF